MARERWFAGEYEITQGIVRDVELRQGLYRATGKRGGNLTVPARNGEVWRPKRLAAGGFVLNVWLGGFSRPQTDAYYEEFLRAVMPQHRLVRFRRVLADGTSRFCHGEVTTAVEPNPVGQLGMRMGIEVVVPSGRWHADASPTTVQSLTQGVLPQTVDLTNVLGSTAPVEDLVVTVHGGISNPTVVDLTDGEGDSFRFARRISETESVSFDVADWSVTGTAAGERATADRLTYTGHTFLTIATARPGGMPRLQLRGANPSPTCRVVVTGRPSYLA